jgi:hypothetical protein
MIRSCLLALAIGAFAPVAMAQSRATAEAAFARFIELANTGGLASPEGQALLTGEAKAAATSAVSALPAPDRVVTISADKAVARIVFKSANGQENDAYFYLDRTDGAWRVSAFRQMAMTEMSYVLLQEMKKRSNLSPADQDEKRNLELLLSSDRQLRTWFDANRPTLDTLAQSAERAPNDPAIESHRKAIGIRSIEKAGDRIVLTIGGAVDNTVGFLRAGPSGPPAISPSDFIWLEPLGDNWYLFRTT